jgi:hypothetical protein
MEEEGVPSTALREVSLLQMLSESAFVVRCVPDDPDTAQTGPHLAPPFYPPMAMRSAAPPLSHGYFKSAQIHIANQLV